MEPQDTPDLEMPPLVSAADLLPPTEEEIPPTPDQSTPPPPGEIVSTFRIEKNRFGAGTWGIDIIHADGELEPLGIWLDREHYDASGPDVAEMLMKMKLPQEHAIRFGRDRQRRIDAQIVIGDNPAVQRLSDEEKKHYELKDEFSQAFVQAQRKKERGSTK
jgi:hypothetical protein